MSRVDAYGDYALEVDGPDADGACSVLLRDPVGRPACLHGIGLSEELSEALPYATPGKPILPARLNPDDLESVRERLGRHAEERAEFLREVAMPPGYVLVHSWTGGGAYQDDGWWADLDEDDDRPSPWPGQVVAMEALVAEGADRGKVVASGDAAGQSDAYGGGAAMFNVFVDEDCRRKGIGTALYDAAGILLGEPLRPYGGGNEGGAIVDFWESRGDPSKMEP